ncbi:MAG TPA: hypothetical protein VMZ27_01465, partial [Candidatus Saccharimonadales bacterium]|nr:hypothetical protein [Candidatus Saccharimonadales bacterium]
LHVWTTSKIQENQMPIQRIAIALTAVSWWLTCEIVRSKTRPATNESILLGWLGICGGLALIALALA